MVVVIVAILASIELKPDQLFLEMPEIRKTELHHAQDNIKI
jgi:hypothetical protein